MEKMHIIILYYHICYEIIIIRYDDKNSDSVLVDQSTT